MKKEIHQLASKNPEITNLIIVYGLILIGIISRILPHPANFAPISALALFSGAYLSRKYAIIIPLVAMFISDIFLGFHITMPYVYISFAIIAILGHLLKNKTSIINIAAFSLTGSAIFFLVTNLGVWLSAGMYPHTIQGLVQCFTLAIPFYRNTLLGDIVYSGALFGIYAIVQVLMTNKKPVKIPNT